MSNGPVAADELRLLIERVERIEEEIKAAQDDRKDVYGEAKSRGFCTKTMKSIVALRKLDADDRRNREAMLDLYKGALGMLDGTPLGTWAVEKLKKEQMAKPAKPAEGAAPAGDAPVDVPPEEAEAPEVAEPPLSIDDARRLGAETARDGKSVTANPFPPRDARRAAWDEAWCRELGTDGMDIPEALRPAGRKPKVDAPPAVELAPGPAPKAEPIAAPVTAGDAPLEAHPIDPVYRDAVAAVLREQYASGTKIQQWFEIGYNRAARIIEQMERDGVVSAASLVGKRDVLLDPQGQPK